MIQKSLGIHIVKPSPLYARSSMLQGVFGVFLESEKA